jgi:hypothetical protein
MIVEHLTISVQGLPGLFEYGFVDYRYTTNRIVKQGYHVERNVTTEKLKLVNQLFEEEQKVQSLIYNKYKLSIPMKENDGIELVQDAQYVNITHPSGVIHSAKFISVTATEQEGSFDRMLELIYYDINPVNYKDYKQPVVNYLRSDAILAQDYTASQVYHLDFFTNFAGSAFLYKLYTLIIPQILTIDTVLEAEKVNGIDVVTRKVLKTGWRVRMYLNEQDMQLLNSRFIVQVPNIIVSKPKLYRPSLSTLTAIEDMQIESKKIDSGIDLYQVDFNFITAIIEQNPYS